MSENDNQNQQYDNRSYRIRLHYRDVCALVNLLETDYDIDTELQSEEKHAYFRLKELKATLEQYTSYKQRKALRG